MTLSLFLYHLSVAGEVILSDRGHVCENESRRKDCPGKFPERAGPCSWLREGGTSGRFTMRRDPGLESEVTDVRVAGWSAAQALGEADVLDPR